jgi:aquaporin Z
MIERHFPTVKMAALAGICQINLQTHAQVSIAIAYNLFYIYMTTPLSISDSKCDSHEKGIIMKKYFAELIGTLFLVLIGCGSAVIAGQQVGYLGIAFAFGLTVLAMVYAIGPISGCHINPAITIGMLVGKKINGKDAIGYIVAQCIGAVLGAAILLAIASGNANYSIASSGLGQNGYGIHSPHQYSMMASFIAELVLTFLFLIVVFGSTHANAPKGFAGISIGLTLVLIHIVGIPITGTSVNPARSFGPALLVGGEAISQLWLFIVAPILGGIIAALLWRAVFDKTS